MDLLGSIVNRINGNELVDKSNKDQEVVEEEAVNNKLHSLLIQSAIFKENKNFDGVHRVSDSLLQWLKLREN